MSPFCPSRALHQGDPFSPYLFLLVTDYLSALVKNYERQGLISGIWVSRRGSSISHLLFADDSILFFKLDEAKHARELLTVFGKSTGQKLRRTKCSMLIREGSDEGTTNLVKRL
jgi:hypothetical protein